MKKFIGTLVVILCVAVVTTQHTNASQVQSSIEAQYPTTYYEGPAYSVGEGLIPQAQSSISVTWTSEGLWINGQRSGLQVYKIDGSFHIRANGRSIYSTHYIVYGGEKYFFAAM